MTNHIHISRQRFSAIAIAGAAVLFTGARIDAADILVPTHYPTIQQAIDAAQTGDHVVIAPGVYNEVINLMGKAITVRSTAPTDPVTVATTIIDGVDLADSVITFNSGEGLDTVIDGLKIMRGEGCIPRGFAHPVGGGMYLRDASPTIQNCFFEQNVAGWGGGLYIDKGDPMIVSTTFHQNRALLPDPEMSFGGGVAAVDSDVHFLDCVFRRNVADIGGGLRVGSATCDMGECSRPLITNGIFENNTAIVRGGGIDNSTTTMGAEASNIRIVNTLFQDNSAHYGAGLNHHTGLAEVIGSRFLRNTAGAIGGGIHVNFEAMLNVVNCEFIQNCADEIDLNSGGAIGSSCGLMVISNSTFTLNAANFGAAVWSCASTDTHVRNCTFFQNTAGTAGGAFRAEGDAPFNSIANSIFWSNTPDQINGPAEVVYSDVQGWFGGTGNVNIAPAFRSADDLRLRSGSPCVDTASNFYVLPDYSDIDENGDDHEPIPWDLAGNPRFVDDPDQGDPDPLDPTVDMGAYEFCRGDVDFSGDIDVNDLNDVIFAWGTADPDADTNADGMVDVADLVSVILNWGPCD